MRSILPVVLLSLLGAFVVGGCQAAIIRAPGVIEDEPPPMIEDPADYFAENVEPILATQCAVCHEDAGASAGAVFLDPGGDYYASIWAYNDGALFVPGDGAGSLLVRKVTVETHRGGTVSDNDAAILRRWIDAEGETTTPPPPPPPVDDPVVTPFFPIEPGANRLPLADVGLPGSELVFDAMLINGGTNLLMTNLELIAGTGGLSVTHPVFIIQDDVSGATREDRDVFGDFNLSAGATAVVAGTHVIAAFPAMGSLAVQFDSAQVPGAM
ncbi:MAG: hypothetical protein H6719_14655 [Sandaracinaceae bacterium]|nr:hypothetical protein [Sandaracinaceae bacterium]